VYELNWVGFFCVHAEMDSSSFGSELFVWCLRSETCSGILERRMKKKRCWFAFAVVCLASMQKGCSAEAVRRPNVVLVLADDMGLGHLETEQAVRLGQFDENSGAPVRSPRIRSLSQRHSLAFERMYADSSVCGPSRYALMTGIRSGTMFSRVRGNTGQGIDHSLKLNGELAFPELLRELGYKTAGFGKWGFLDDPSFCGFEYFLGLKSHQDAHQYFAEKLFEDVDGVTRYTSQFCPRNNGISDSTQEMEICNSEKQRTCDFIPDVLHSQAVNWIRETNQNSPDSPFFLFYSTQIPHDGGFEKSSVGNVFPIPSLDGAVNYSSDEFESYSPAMAAMGSSISNHFDIYMEDLMKSLDVLNIANETLFIILSDNGPAISIAPDRDSGDLILDEPMNANGPFRGYKRQLFEGSLRIPNLFIWPSVIPGNGARISNRVVQLSDVAPTLLQAAGFSMDSFPEQFNGFSFLDELLNETESNKNAQNHQHLMHELCWRDAGEIGQHSNCDIAITFGSELQFRTEWTARTDLRQDIVDTREGFVKKLGNLTELDLNPGSFVPKIHEISNEYLDVFSEELFQTAIDLVLKERIVPDPENSRLTTRVPTTRPTASPSTTMPSAIPTARTRPPGSGFGEQGNESPSGSMKTSMKGFILVFLLLIMF